MLATHVQNSVRIAVGSDQDRLWVFPPRPAGEHCPSGALRGRSEHVSKATNLCSNQLGLKGFFTNGCLYRGSISKRHGLLSSTLCQFQKRSAHYLWVSQPTFALRNLFFALDRWATKNCKAELCHWRMSLHPDL